MRLIFVIALFSGTFRTAIAGTDTLELYRETREILKINAGDYAAIQKKFGSIDRLNTGKNPCKSYLEALTLFSKSQLISGRFEEALILCQKGCRYARQHGYMREQGILLSNRGIAYLNLGKPDSAVHHFENAARIFMLLHDSRLLASSHQNIGSILLNQKQYARAMAHFTLARQKFTEAGDSVSACYSVINMAIIHKKNNRLKHALQLFKTCYVYGQRKNDPELHFAGASNIADVLTEQNRMSEALSYINKMLALGTRLNSTSKKALAYIGLAKIYHHRQQPAAEKAAVDSAIALGEKSLEKFRLIEVYTQAAELYETLKDYKKAVAFYKQHRDLLRETNSLEINRIVLETEARFENDRKTLELEKKEKEIARRNGWIILISGSFVILLLVTVILVYRHHKNIQLMQKEHELSLIRSILKGEEKERLRTAMELHDGLGAMLAAVKMQFAALQKNIGPEHDAEYTRALHYLGDAATDVRRISHNLLPGLLLENGLAAALQNYVGAVSAGRAITVHYHNFLLHQLDVYAKDAELHILRIVQEIVTNALKHSHAANIYLQINREGQNLVLSYEDDGIGFDAGNAAKSAGLIHLHERIQSMYGKMELNTVPGKGVLLLIYIPVT